MNFGSNFPMITMFFIQHTGMNNDEGANTPLESMFSGGKRILPYFIHPMALLFLR